MRTLSVAVVLHLLSWTEEGAFMLIVAEKDSLEAAKAALPDGLCRFYGPGGIGTRLYRTCPAAVQWCSSCELDQILRWYGSQCCNPFMRILRSDLEVFQHLLVRRVSGLNRAEGLRLSVWVRSGSMPDAASSG